MHHCYDVIPAGRASDEFMTITYQCTDFMRLKSPGVVHLDGSARPQRVVKAHNPSFHSILSRYHALTGIPSLINTSFNLHEEPIVCSPGDAIRAFLQGGFRYMQLGEFLVRS
jgi:carbamoyltransferase